MGRVATIWLYVLICGVVLVTLFQSIIVGMAAILVGVVLTVLHKELS